MKLLMIRTNYYLVIFECLFNLHHTALGQKGANPGYTIAVENIQHAKESLPGQIFTEDPEFELYK